MKQEYPKWIFHKSEAPKIVNTKEEHDQAGKGWEETPFTKGEESNAAKDESAGAQGQGAEIKEKDFVAMTVAQLKEALIAKGIEESELKGLKKDELIAKLGAL